MSAGIQYEQAKTAIQNVLNNPNKGYFITINSQYSDYYPRGKNTGYSMLNVTHMEQFKTQVQQIGHQFNKYAFGRSYQSQGNRFAGIGAIEVGNHSNNLHVHFAAFPNVPCNSCWANLETHLRSKILPHFKVQQGWSGMIFQPFDLEKRERFTSYTLKALTLTGNKFDVTPLVYF